MKPPKFNKKREKTEITNESANKIPRDIFVTKVVRQTMM